MLSAAKDVLESGNHHPPPKHNGTTPINECVTDPSEFTCSPISTGSVLLADILPGLIVKLIAPFTITRVPYGVRHCVVVFLQACGYIIVALSGNITVGIIGVIVASISFGIGGMTYLSLASHFHEDVVTAWSSGTGGAGLFASLVYALLTDQEILGLSPRVTLFVMLIIPFCLAYVFWKILETPPAVKKFDFRNPVFLEPRFTGGLEDNEDDLLEPLLSSGNNTETSEVQNVTFVQSLSYIKPLLKFMIPFAVVYFAEYFINQGLVEFIGFDCSHGFGLSISSQYRWYQVIYQLGVFIARSLPHVLPISTAFLPLLGFLQIINTGIFFTDAISRFIPHILIIFLMIFYEGLIGGSAYVNTFRNVHKTVDESTREFSMSFVSVADAAGIALAGLAAIPVHNYICSHWK